jgi:hypothetical protein
MIRNGSKNRTGFKMSVVRSEHKNARPAEVMSSKVHADERVIGREIAIPSGSSYH